MLPEPSPAVGRQGRGMNRLEYQVLLAIDECSFGARIATPEHVNQSFAVGRQGLDGGVGEEAPAQPLVAVGHVGSHGQRGVEQQHPLLGPSCQVAIGGHVGPQVVSNLLEDVEQRGRHGHPFGHREAQSHGLSGLMVGVLPDDHHLHLVEGTEVEGVEDEVSRWVTGAALVLLAHLLGESGEVGLVELRP